ncbi:MULTISPECIES: aminotransferase class V-fold PLP-dependent enzyme [Prauserella salsuginis group]|uniref:Selenocysteine lyase/cysteine desulfurase n=2 Tax=Prauserella salsuginis group TaxID=2893672 RepID=A0A839XMK1_9PSEU|nr:MULTISPECIES: aminotransferase class V-fold PLP-dependent enzyme [Prauserella salsuginis group]MBB3665102.1 selenocysteine lyase/cysteine desulfurase [Prauserella sediminis]MCR3718572.1 Selenocysteine lyase/Cysteine desulfurase [Prauserella flava]MCR3733142.1 Selenocysteine lyase/Cysteine desulfurase [Prauserella salsuginis]
MSASRHAFGAAFDVPTGYVNTPSIGIPSAAVADTVAAAVDRWRTGADDPPDFTAAVDTSRDAFARLVGVPAERVAVGATVAGLLAPVAAGLPDGARVLSVTGEFTSVTFPFAAQAHRGVTVETVPVAELASAVDGHDLVVVSVVQSADGTVADLDALRAVTADAGIAVALDVSQAAGWLALDLDWADWVVGAGYKWLLSPRGAAWLAVHPRALERGHPVGANWYAGEDPWDTVYGLPLRLASGARRFDASPAWLPFVGAAAALDYLASLDLDAVHAHCAGLADALLDELGLPAAGSAIVAVDTDVAPEQLARAGLRASVRAGRLRMGFHLYNTWEDVDLAVAALR